MLRQLFISAAFALVGCASSDGVPSASGSTFSSLDIAGLASLNDPTDPDYRIGATDVLNITVFQVEDLTFPKVRVDAGGTLQMPLIGEVRAVGKTPAELAAEIATRLRERYLRNPQVAVTVEAAASQKVTVDGAVTKPGVYEMRGRTTLLQAVAMAEGPTRVADLGKVVVFRTVEGRRMAALFDLAQIRSGEMEDPYVQGNDVVVVDTSRLSSALRNIVEALPGLAAFSYL